MNSQPSTKNPKISIIMPVLNGAKTICRAINSIIAQDYPNFELIILDGASTDDTLLLLEKYKPIISSLTSSKDGNPSIAVNKGIALATGDLVVQLMCDDFYEKDTFRRIADAYFQHPEADIITCGGRIIAYDTSKKRFRTLRSHTSQAALALTFDNVCKGEAAICCRFIKRDVFKTIGTFHTVCGDGKISYSNDKEFLLRAIVHGMKNYTINHLGHNYVSHEDSLTFSGNRKMTVRLYTEHYYYATEYLSLDTLSPKQRALMHFWRYHQSARLAFYHLFHRDFQIAWPIIIKNIRLYPLHWFFSFIWAPFDLLLRRTQQKLIQVYYHFTGRNLIDVET